MNDPGSYSPPETPQPNVPQPNVPQSNVPQPNTPQPGAPTQPLPQTPPATFPAAVPNYAPSYAPPAASTPVTTYPAAGYATPAAPKSNTGLKVAGGCAAFGCLGFFGLLVLAGGFLFLNGRSNSSETEGAPTVQTQPASPPSDDDPTTNQPADGSTPQAQPDTNAQPAPTTGSLENLIQKQVGNYSVVSAQRQADATQMGANDGIVAEYASSQNVHVALFVLSWPSENAASNWLDGRVKDAVDKGGELRVSKGEGGKRLAGVANRDGKSIIFRTNGQLSWLVLGPPANVVEFNNALPY